LTSYITPYTYAIIPSNLNHSTNIEIQKINSIRDKLPDILQKAFDKQKSYEDRGKREQDFYVVEKVLVKINVRQNTFSDRYEDPHTI